MTDASSEQIVRKYLLYLVNPSSLRDEAAIEKAQEVVEEAADPIAKVKAIVALEQLESLDGEELRQGFIEHAKAWAEAEGITVSALRTIGVPTENLEAAGLVEPARRASRTRTGGRTRAPRLSLEEVAAKLPSVEFRLTDLAAAIDREPATTRNYLNKLVEEGVVAEVGTDPAHDGRGKAPKLYVRA